MKKVWVEIDKQATAHNVKQVRNLLQPRTKLWAVVKSNAYGHGNILFSKLLDSYGVDGFCVDSLIEAIKLRENKIRKPILVLGPTLPHNSLEAAEKQNITLTLSHESALKKLYLSKAHPKFHLKIDTGMHRQGFYETDFERLVKKMPEDRKQDCTGIYTHFADATNIADATFTEQQFTGFSRIMIIAKTLGLHHVLFHAAATGGTFMNKKYHLDAIRIGMGLYGLWPSPELAVQRKTSITLKSVLSWKSIISEIKNVPKNAFIGYDLTEQTQRDLKIAVVPIGYWHGFDRGLSRVGEVLVMNKRARVLGTVSMDLIVIDITKIRARIGTEVTLLGGKRNTCISAEEMAKHLHTNSYEVITRINPLIERVCI
jgi:alanine racemase